MREHDTLQALLRFGRDAGGATVYVDTATLPDWMPTHGRGDVRGVSDGLVGVLDALEDVGPASTADLVEHDAVDVSARQVRTHLGTLEDYGVLSSTTDPDDGRRTIYGVDNDAGVTATGVVNLPDPDTGERPARSRPWSRPTGVYDTGESSGSPTYDRSIYVRLPEDRGDDESDDTAATTPKDELAGNADPPPTPGERIREVTPPALPDGGTVTFDVSADTDVTLDAHVKVSDDAGYTWYVTSGSKTGDVTCRRRSTRPATRRRTRAATLPDRGARRGSTRTHGGIEALADADTDTGDAD